jgi:hypothetical protein
MKKLANSLGIVFLRSNRRRDVGFLTVSFDGFCFDSMDGPRPASALVSRDLARTSEVDRRLSFVHDT